MEPSHKKAIGYMLASTASFAVMNALHAKGAQGVILGCTELPFLIQQEHTTIPVFDTTAIHSTRTLDMALAD